MRAMWKRGGGGSSASPSATTTPVRRLELIRVTRGREVGTPAAEGLDCEKPRAASTRGHSQLRAGCCRALRDPAPAAAAPRGLAPLPPAPAPGPSESEEETLPCSGGCAEQRPRCQLGKPPPLHEQGSAAALREGGTAAAAGTSMWTPTEEEKYGVVICSFRGSIPQGLVLELGETVQILEKCEGWYRGVSIKKPNVKGIFPANYIHLKKAIVSNRGQYETVVPLEDSVVTEVTATLQEWAILWKQLYVGETLLSCWLTQHCRLSGMRLQEF